MLHKLVNETGELAAVLRQPGTVGSATLKRLPQACWPACWLWSACKRPFDVLNYAVMPCLNDVTSHPLCPSALPSHPSEHPYTSQPCRCLKI